MKNHVSTSLLSFNFQLNIICNYLGRESQSGIVYLGLAWSMYVGDCLQKTDEEKPRPSWAAPFSRQGFWSVEECAEHKEASRHVCISFFLLLAVDVMRTTALCSCNCDLHHSDSLLLNCKFKYIPLSEAPFDHNSRHETRISTYHYIFFLLKTKITGHACVCMYVYVHRCIGAGQRSTSGSIPPEEYILLFESFIGLNLAE